MTYIFKQPDVHQIFRSFILSIFTNSVVLTVHAAEKPLPIDALERHTRLFEQKIGFDDAMRNHVSWEKVAFDWSTMENPPHLAGWKVIGKRHEAMAGPRAREKWKWGYARNPKGVQIEIISHKIGDYSALLGIRDFAYKSNMMEPPYLKGPTDLGTLSLTVPELPGYEVHWAYRDLEFSVEATDQDLALKTAYWLNSIAKSSAVHQNAQSYIDQLRRGEDFNDNASIAPLVASIRSSPTTLTVLANELADGTPDVRLKLVKVLEKIGFELDTATPGKFQIIRDHRVIRALVVQGFAKDDAAANAAADVLLVACTPSDLAAFRDIYTKSLRQLSDQYLRLATKAKAVEASAYVEKMAVGPKWQKNPEEYELIQIARAALGNQLVEDIFIKALSEAEKNLPPAPKNRFYNVGAARDGTEVARRLGTLGAIGTSKSLLVVCSYLRSTLKSYVAGVSERSVRYAALDALRYNFPDERVIHAPRQLAEWRAAEEFCTTKVSAAYEGPTPAIPPHHAYPHM